MRYFIDPGEFIRFFNPKCAIATHNTITAAVHDKAYEAILLMRADHDRMAGYTIEFVLKFTHKRHNNEGVMQRAFHLEHHPEDKSRHVKPHVQIHIHGPATEDKIGKMWINLELASQDEYTTCIEGFFKVLEDVISSCEDGLADEILDLEETQSLEAQKRFLIERIEHSLKHNEIEFEGPSRKKVILTHDELQKLTGHDKLLVPFFKI